MNIHNQCWLLGLLFLLSCLLMASCADDDSFSTSQYDRLTFSADTVMMDTLFSNVPSASKSLWVYNRSGEGLRCTSVRLEKGGSSGFRVNVDGIYLGEQSGWQTSDVEIRDKDSIRVFVEATLPSVNDSEPTLCDDNIIFTLESGAEQRISLRAYAWNARLLRDVRISCDSMIVSSDMPVVVYGGLRVDSGATLTVAQGTTLYFHADAGIDVYGCLKTVGTADGNVVLRGDRLDRMFDYLPYDRVPAQWLGIRFHSSSYGNELSYTDLHSANTGIEIDSSDVDRHKLTLSHCTVHNCQGYGVRSVSSRLTVLDSQITNTLYDCLSIEGGHADLNNCTIAQFYPFDARRGKALSVYNSQHFAMLNSIVTGYADDELDVLKDTDSPDMLFDHSIVRTPRVTTADSTLFVDVLFEDVADTVSMGEKHFKKIDTDNLIYDFRLDSLSAAIGRADPLTALPDDRNGLRRDDKPDAGCFEY